MSSDLTDRQKARRAGYLRVARRLFVERGFERTSTDMIVAQAGGSKATLYKYFPTKQALVVGLIADVVEHSRAAQGGLDVADLGLEAALTKIGRATLDAVVSDAAVETLRLCLGEYGRFPELARAVWENGPARSYATFQTFLKDRCARGELRIDDIQLASEHFLAGIAGHIQLKVAMGMRKAPPPRERARRVQAAVETFVARYAA